MMKLPENTHDNDIVTINAGGKIFQVLRSTLCLPKNTAFARLFAKKKNHDEEPASDSYWSESTSLEVVIDTHGNVFLDHDPELIEIILNFLRAKKVEDPSDPIVEAPHVPKHKSKNFRRILNRFGLTGFFYYPSTVTTINKLPLESTTKTLVSFDNIDDMTDETLWGSSEISSENASIVSFRTYHASAIEDFGNYCG